MCGIVGGIALQPDARPAFEGVRRASCLLAHRGPDADGYWKAPSGRAALAHRRLSIIDLETGQQPMLDDTGRVGLVFNGEIYNYRELRRDLAREGVAFRTDSDTEVILRLYEHTGAECVRHLRGMFAFALWDDRSGQVLLARDRVGKKPLYYTVENHCLYFASSLQALRATSATQWKVEPSAVDTFLTLAYIPAPETIYRTVSKLEAGTMLTVVDGAPETRRYWDLATDVERFTGTFSDAVDQLDEIVNTAVRLRLRSDVPLGVFLSGGVDSSLVAAVAARHATTRVATFSIGFDVAAFDESPFAERVAQQLGTDHHVFRAQPDLLRTLPAMVWHFGEPFADSSALPTWMLAHETRKHVTVALGGDGGDEAFGGYEWYRTAARLRRIAGSMPSGTFSHASRILGTIAQRALPRSRGAGQMRRGLALLALQGEADRYAALRSFIGRADYEALYAGELLEWRRSQNGNAVPLLGALYRNCSGSDLRRMRYVDIRTYLADCLLPKVDVATMAHGLEARAPLLDHEVVRFSMTLPDEWLIGPNGGKTILRAVLSRYLPPAQFERPKHGFSLPLTTWFAGMLRDSVSALATSERLLDTGWFQPDGIRLLVREHADGLRDQSSRLFSLLVLDEWLKRA